MNTSPFPSDALLDAAALVLQPAGFSVAIEQLQPAGRAWLLAENELFAVAGVAGETLGDATAVEAVAVERLLDRLGGLDSGAKRWDAYLVLLTPQRWEAIDSRDRVELVYNTRGIRRLVAAQLVPDEKEGGVRPALTRALRPFLPLAPPLGAALENLDDALVNALIVNGVSPEAAPRYVAAYRAKQSLDDV